MTAVTIPPEVLADVAARPEAYRPEPPRGPSRVIDLRTGDLCAVRRRPSPTEPRIRVAHDGQESKWLDAWALVGSVNGGPRPEVGQLVLVLAVGLDADEAGWVGVVTEHTPDTGPIVVTDGPVRWEVTRWALLPAAAAPDAVAAVVERITRAAAADQRGPYVPIVGHDYEGDAVQFQGGADTVLSGNRIGIPPGRWRTGHHWGATTGSLATVIERGAGPADQDGRRPDDRLLGTLLAEDAARAVEAVNLLDRYRTRLEQPCGECHDCGAPALKAEVERLREHSVTLNSVGWRLAVALGDVEPEAEGAIAADAGDLAERAARAIDERDQLRAALGVLRPAVLAAIDSAGHFIPESAGHVRKALASDEVLRALGGGS